jgi:hypothetical protein
MHRFDCTGNGLPVPAVAICATCGVAVCHACTRAGYQEVRHSTVFSSAERAVTRTRQIACAECAKGLSSRHSASYRFAAPGGRLAAVI